MSIIALISCVSQKVDYKTEAKNMYISSLFKKGIKYIENILKRNRQINHFLKNEKSAIKFQKIYFLEDKNELQQRREGDAA